MRVDLDGIDLSLLDPWAVDARYPIDIPEVDPVAARTIIDIAAATVRMVRSALLGDRAEVNSNYEAACACVAMAMIDGSGGAPG